MHHMLHQIKVYGFTLYVFTRILCGFTLYVSPGGALQLTCTGMQGAPILLCTLWP